MRGNPVNKIQKIWLMDWIATLPLAMTVEASFSHPLSDFYLFLVNTLNLAGKLKTCDNDFYY